MCKLSSLCGSSAGRHWSDFVIMSPEAGELRRKLLRNGSLVLDVKVIPRSRSPKVEELPNGKLKIRVRAAPEAGKANGEVCAVLAEYLAVPKGNVEVILGRSSLRKRIRTIQ
jgi:uncharacterized protein